MSVTLDANVLIDASNRDSLRHALAGALLQRLAAGPDLLYVFWPVAMAYLRISTHPGIFAEPLEPAVAQRNLGDLLGRPHVRTPGETTGFWAAYQQTAQADVIRGNLVPDAHLVTLMRQHGVSTIWTADRDFRRFPGITSRHPDTQR